MYSIKVHHTSPYRNTNHIILCSIMPYHSITHTILYCSIPKIKPTFYYVVVSGPSLGRLPWQDTPGELAQESTDPKPEEWNAETKEDCMQADTVQII